MNKQILQIAELLNNDMTLFYTIEYYDQLMNSQKFKNLSIENSGKERFLTDIKKVRELGATTIIIKLYRKSQKDFKKKPEASYIIEVKETSIGALAGFEPYGGLDGFIDKSVRLATLQTELERIKADKDRLEQENRILKKQNKDIERELDTLKNLIKEKEWEIKDLERQYKYQIEDIQRKNKSFERIIELAGITISKSLGINKNDILGIIEENKDLQKEIQQNEQKVEYQIDDETKNEAYRYLDTITKIIRANIDATDDPDKAVKYVNSILTVIQYMHISEQHFNLILSTIIKQNDNEPEAEKEINTESEYGNK